MGHKIRTFEKSKLQVMLNELVKEKKSKLVQIMNEVDDLTDEEKSFCRRWCCSRAVAGCLCRRWCWSSAVAGCYHLQLKGRFTKRDKKRSSRIMR